MESHEPDDNMDLAELEARLYAQIHHNSGDVNITAGTKNSASINESDVFKENIVRVVNPNNRSLVNNATLNQQSKSRYWLNPLEKRSEVHITRSNPHTKYTNITPDEIPNADISNTPKPMKKFVPYTSLLSGIETVAEADSVIEPDLPPATGAVVAPSSDKYPKTKIINPFNRVNLKKIENFMKSHTKKVKIASTPRKSKLETIILESSDPDDDDVIEIPTAPLPTVCLDSSDDSEILNKEFTKPKSKLKKTQSKNTSSPRCQSPSVSSIHSDDFVGQTERSRINELFGGGQCFPDDELMYDQTTVGSLIRNVAEKSDSTIFVRPREDSKGVDSDSTQTSSHTSSSQDVNLKRQISNSKCIETKSTSTSTECSNSSDLSKNINAIRKTLGNTKTTPAKAKRRSSPITTEVQVQKKKKISKRRKSGSLRSSDYNSDNSSDEESPHGKYVKLTTSTPNIQQKSEKHLSKYKVGRRAKFDSANYSDQDFISILSNIVNPSESCSEIDSLDEAEDKEEIVSSKSTSKGKDDNDVVVVQENLPVSSTIDLNSNSDNEAEQKNKPQNNLDVDVGWNYEMKHFYNNRWSNDYDDEFENIWYRMPTDRRYWPINNRDKYPINKHVSKIRCRNCNEFGHISARCSNPQRPIVCYLCGNQGHREPRCPNTLCLRCGSKTKVSTTYCSFCANERALVCALCKCKGHSIVYCPDKWRRYHSTLEDNGIVNSDVVYNSKKNCCICSKRGHTSQECTYAGRIFNMFGAGTDRIQSHVAVYSNKFEATAINEYQYNLVSFHDNYKFQWDNYALKQNRFLSRALNEMKIPEPAKEVIDEKPKKRNKRKKSKEGKKKINDEAKITKFSFTNEINKLDNSKNFNLNFITQPLQTPPAPIIRDNTKTGVANLVIKVNAQTFERTVQDVDKMKSVGLNDDSNYSFSEFYDSNANTTVALSSDVKESNITNQNSNIPIAILESENASTAPDFIPLPKDTDKEIAVNIAETVSDAKVFLTKEHCKILMTQPGTEFLEQTSSKLNLKVMICWESYSNILNVNGIRSNQDMFHKELIEYLDRTEDEKYRKKLENSIQVPRKKIKVIEFIQGYLKRLEKRYSKGRVNYDRVINTDDGKLHLAALKLSLTNLKNDEKSVMISEITRNDIKTHLRFIFAPINISTGVIKAIAPDAIGTVLVKEANDSIVQTPQASTSFSSVADNAVESEQISNLLDDINVDGDNLTMNIFENEILKKYDNNEMQPAEDFISINPTEENNMTKWWHRKCKRLMLSCRSLLKQQENKSVFNRLDIISGKASTGKLTFTDYLKLLQMHKNLRNMNIRKKNSKTASLQNVSTEYNENNVKGDNAKDEHNVQV